MFNQDPKEEVQRVDLQDEGGGEGGGGGERTEEQRGGGDGEKETEEKVEEGKGRVAEEVVKRGGVEAEGQREARGGEDDREIGEKRGGDGGGTKVMDSISVDFEQKVEACNLDLDPKGQGCRPPGSCWFEEAVVSLLQVDNSSSESDEALQREESQRRSRRRFRRINPRGEREVIITDGHEDAFLTSV